MLIVGHHEVRDVLAGREHDIVECVRRAYVLHLEGRSAVPHATFLRLPAAAGEAGSANRIIGLPAYLGGGTAVAGIKWIASFPGNLERGLDRASAVIVLNSVETGQPEVLLEASLISAARTAAGAALAADVLLPPGSASVGGITLIGCGVINETILRYLRVLRPSVGDVVLYDRVAERAGALARRLADVAPGTTVTVADDRDEAVRANGLISIATTASTPHMDLALAPPSATVLHVSLRDLTPAAILAHHNVVDDPDHACRENTSVHLAEQLTGGRDFIDATLPEVLVTGRPMRRDPGRAVVFSPFGLGVLDLAVAQLVCDEVARRGYGVRVESFLAPAHNARPAGIAHV